MKKATKRFDTGLARTYRCDESTREQLKRARVACGLTTKAFVALAMKEQLDALAEAVLGLGIQPHRGATRPIRIPLDPSIVASLQRCSLRCSLPQSLLLLTALRRMAVVAIAEPKKPKPSKPAKSRKPRAKSAAAKS
jgi:hypothetical protein